MRHVYQLSILPLLTLLLFGKTATAQTVLVTTDKDTCIAGDSILITVRNNLDSAIFFQAMSVDFLAKKERDNWKPVQSGRYTGGTKILKLLPGDSYSYHRKTVVAWTHSGQLVIQPAPPGVYRIWISYTTIDPYSPRYEIREEEVRLANSEEFVIK